MHGEAPDSLVAVHADRGGHHRFCIPATDPIGPGVVNEPKNSPHENTPVVAIVTKHRQATAARQATSPECQQGWATGRLAPVSGCQRL